MSEGAIEPTRVYAPGEPYQEPIKTGRQRFYETYNTREVPLGGDAATVPQPGGGSGGPRFTQRAYSMFTRIPGSGMAPVPSGVPRWVGNRGLIIVSWMAAMAMVSWDEWHTYKILPRPARLWYTTLTYGLLAVISTIDIVAPIANLLAVGFTIAVSYQYFTGTVQFGQTQNANPSTNPPAGPGAPPTPTTGANPGTPPASPTGSQKLGGHT